MAAHNIDKSTDLSDIAITKKIMLCEEQRKKSLEKLKPKGLTT